MTDLVQLTSSLGVNTHVDATGSAYGNVALVQACLAYLGISLIRDHAYSVDLAAYSTLARAGVGLDLILDDDPKAEIDSLTSVAAAIRTFEGPNEVDYQPVLTNHIANPVRAAVTEQRSIQTAIRASAAVSAVPLIAESVADPSNLSTYAGNLAYADMANLHAYAVQGQSPQTVLAADLAMARSLSSQPAAVTETGYFTLPQDPDGNGVDKTVQAKLTLDTLFDSAWLGIQPTFLYELFDEGSDPAGADPELHYGLFNADGSPKLAATALHNLTAILAAANAAPGLAPTLSLGSANLPDTGHTLVLTGSAGTTVVAVWAEPPIWDSAAHAELAAPVVTATINFGTLIADATVLDPLTGTAAIAQYTDVSSVTVDLTDHPLVITLSAPPSTAGVSSPTGGATAVPPASGTATVVPPPIAGATDTPITREHTIGVFRFFDASNGTYFYTADPSEAETVRLTRPTLVPEGAGGIGLFAVDPASNDAYAAPVYRFFDTRFGTHLFTISASERDSIVATRPDLVYEAGSVFYEHASAQAGDTPVYRFFDDVHGTHFYTDSAAERAAIVSTRPDLVAEGVAFHEPAANPN